MSSPWLYISVSENRHNAIETLNKQFKYHWEDADHQPESLPSDIAHDPGRQDTAPGDEWVTYHLTPNEFSIFLLGRVSRNRCKELQDGLPHRNTDPDFILEGGIDISTGNNSRLSMKQCRLYYNENKAWMLEDTSRHGCIVNGYELVSEHRQLGYLGVTSRIALRPDMPNLIDLRAAQIRIQIGKEEPCTLVASETLNQRPVPIPRVPSVRTATMSSLTMNLSSERPRYYHLPQHELLDHFPLMGIRDGRSCIGYKYTDIVTAETRFREIRATINVARAFGILSIIDVIYLDNNFMAVTEQPNGVPLVLEDVDPASLSFIFVQMLQKLVFLGGRRIKHGNISAQTIMIHGHPMETQLTGIALAEPCAETDVTALGLVITAALEKSHIDWSKCAIGPYLVMCLNPPREHHEYELAAHLLTDMQIDEVGDTLFPFESTGHVIRIFEIKCIDARGTLVCKEDLHRIVNAVGKPRHPFETTTKVTLKSSGDGWAGEYISYKQALKLLERHQIEHAWKITGLGRDKRITTNFRAGREIYQHVTSGMWNISQVLDIFPDFLYVHEFPQVDEIQEIRGNATFDGFYISEQSFYTMIQILTKYFQVELKDYADARPATSTPSYFNQADFQKIVQIPTGWAARQFLYLSRTGESVPSSDCFQSLHECRSWLREAGLPELAVNLGCLTQPIPTEWRTIPTVPASDHSWISSPSLSPSISSDGSYRFQFGARARARTRARTRPRPMPDRKVEREDAGIVAGDMSGNESGASTVILEAPNEPHEEVGARASPDPRPKKRR